MSVTVKEAYDAAKKILGDDLIVYRCIELENYWIFPYAWKDGTNIMMPPIQVTKNGICDLWNKHFSDIFEESEWLDEHGKDIPIEKLEKMSK